MQCLFGDQSKTMADAVEQHGVVNEIRDGLWFYGKEPMVGIGKNNEMGYWLVYTQDPLTTGLHSLQNVFRIDPRIRYCVHRIAQKPVTNPLPFKEVGPVTLPLA